MRLAPDASAAIVASPRWVSLRIEATDDAARERVVQMLMDGGAGAVQELGSALLTHLQEGAALDSLCAELAHAGATVERTSLGEVDWSTRWVTRVGVQRIGRIAVAPPWMSDDIADAEIPILIEPAMAFGTGEHETTRGVLSLMQSLVAPGALVADLGSGSGVLAIAAAKLGAARVVAIELDPDAIGNANENVERNGVAQQVSVLQGDAGALLPLVAPVSLILANIISSVVMELSPLMARALPPGGKAVISGILVTEREHLLSSLAADGWVLESELREGEWWSSVIARQ
ncbi:MAG TPA: 50S ribosomal protein L11 methyltransferase [Gemmatimonadaceae bacterium]|nr:50S ribosomal protein L11 methyltransferase [Gemmatimonadaceae bacterium]